MTKLLYLSCWMNRSRMRRRRPRNSIRADHHLSDSLYQYAIIQFTSVEKGQVFGQAQLTDVGGIAGARLVALGRVNFLVIRRQAVEAEAA